MTEQYPINISSEGGNISLKMNGECDWCFINTGFPMNHAKGQTAREAVINAMRVMKK